MIHVLLLHVYVCIYMTQYTCIFYVHAASQGQFLLQPQNNTVLEGEPYSMECVAFHLYPDYMYYINYTMHLTYPDDEGLPVLTLDSVSLSEHDGIRSACISGPIGVYNADFISSWPAVLTIHSE